MHMHMRMACYDERRYEGRAWIIERGWDQLGGLTSQGGRELFGHDFVLLYLYCCGTLYFCGTGHV